MQLKRFLKADSIKNKRPDKSVRTPTSQKVHVQNDRKDKWRRIHLNEELESQNPDAEEQTSAQNQGRGSLKRKLNPKEVSDSGVTKERKGNPAVMSETENKQEIRSWGTLSNTLVGNIVLPDHPGREGDAREVNAKENEAREEQ